MANDRAPFYQKLKFASVIPGRVRSNPFHPAPERELFVNSGGSPKNKESESSRLIFRYRLQVVNLRGKLDKHFPKSRLNGLPLASFLGSVRPGSFPLPWPVMVQSSRRPLWQGKFQIQKYLAGQSGTLVDFL
jgi:hypothetical protein